MRILIFFALAMGIAGCEINVTAEAHLKKAQELLDRGDAVSSVIELKSALQRFPNDPRLRWQLGMVNLEYLGDGASAEKELRRARELGVEDSSIMPPLAESLLMQGRHAEVVSMKIDPQFSTAAQTGLWVSRSLALLMSGDTSGASVALGNAGSVGEKMPYLETTRARLVAAQGDRVEAIRILDVVVEDSPSYAPAWSLLGQLLLASGDAEAADKAMTRAMGLRVGNQTDQLNRSLCRLILERYDDAAADIASLRQQGVRSAQVEYVDGLLQFAQERYQLALEKFQQVRALESGHLGAVYFLGVTNFLLGNKESSIAFLEQISVRFPGHQPTRAMLAAIHASEGDFIKAEQLLKPVANNDSGDTWVLSSLGDALTRQGKFVEGLDYLHQVVDRLPASAQARLNLGVGLLAAGDAQAGIRALTEAEGLDPELTEAPIRKILALLDNHDFIEAMNSAVAIRDRSPDEVTGHLLIGLVHLAKQEIVPASEAFELVLRQQPGNISAGNALAFIAVRESRFDEAESYYQETLRFHPNNLSALVNLASVARAQGKLEEMESMLLAAIEHHPAALKPRLMLGSWYLNQNRADEAAVLMQEDRVSGSFMKNAAAVHILGNAQFFLGDFEAAGRSFSVLVDLLPDNAQAQFLLAEALVRNGDIAGAAASLQRGLALDEGNTDALILLARLQIDLRQLEDADATVLLVRQRAADAPELMILEGRLANAKENLEVAEQAYEKVFSQQPNNVNLLALVDVRWRQGKSDAALIDLQDWLEKFPDDQLIRFELANRQLMDGQREKAILGFEEVLRFAPNNVVALNNLAWLLREEEPARALSLSERANSIAPGSPAVADTFATLLFETGDSVRAMGVLDRALDKGSDDQALRYRKAMILAAVGQFEEALASIALALAPEKEFPYRAEALELQRQLERNIPKTK